MPHKDPEAKREYMRQYRKNKPEVLRKWREENKEKWEEYCRQYRKQNADRYRELKNGESYKKWSKEYAVRYYKENKEKHLARVKVEAAKKAGKLIPEPCEVCGEIKVQAHHDDYSKPLQVRWLCTFHHAEHHKNERKKEKHSNTSEIAKKDTGSI